MISIGVNDILAAEIAHLEAELDSALAAVPPRKRKPLEEIQRKLAALKERARLGS